MGPAWFGTDGVRGVANEELTAELALALGRASARVFAGNFLFSTGPNSQGGGKRTTRGHYDVPMRDCTVMLDNEVIIDRGKVTDPKMRVERVATV